MTDASTDTDVVYREVLTENLSRTQIVQYAGASGDYNPLHTDEVYATQAAGYRAVFAHGMLVMGLAGRALQTFAGNRFIRRYSGRFHGQVWPGDWLAVEIRKSESPQENSCSELLELTVTTRDGRQVFSGQAVVEVEQGLAAGSSPCHSPSTYRRYFPMPTNRYQVGSVTDFEKGSVSAVRAGSYNVAVIRNDNTFYAFMDACPHDDCFFSEYGDVSESELTCLCHMSTFDLETGRRLDGPSFSDATVLRVEIADGKVIIEAETQE